MKTLEVIAAFGLSVPMEDKPKNYITDNEPATVPDTTYYQRRLADGDLELYTKEEPASKKPAPRAATVKTTGE